MHHSPCAQLRMMWILWRAVGRLTLCLSLSASVPVSKQCSVGGTGFVPWRAVLVLVIVCIGASEGGGRFFPVRVDICPGRKLYLCLWAVYLLQLEAVSVYGVFAPVEG